ncbi:hypothetical protein I317_07197 [Kwoniella heveanensis CBS 569]|uniref:RFX-type winged-helix domain-containing protein n=1 Tax=Kwoniella heveanensis BCC8398 TaxID=1296120 RepID=A0A1B9GWD5_9TREE|nr:hypothetical protein I316_02889 [Kwoniella heveanensis BCC8398]OCF39020.1 hypothetical protein I317_07197 [Kwoniella heveanensis CBS 569]
MARTVPVPLGASSSLLSASSSSRQIAPLPHHSQAHSRAGGGPTSTQTHRTMYHPAPSELVMNARNPLFLSLKSGIEEEIDYALPKLVVASFDEREKFLLKYWVDSVSALKVWPEKWVESLEQEAALDQLRKTSRASSFDPAQVLEETGGLAEEGSSKKRRVEISREDEQERRIALGAIPEWTIPPSTLQRATNSLLILRNASFHNSNAEMLCRASFLAFLDRFFQLPIAFILNLSLRYPEPVHHIFTIVQSIFPYLRPEAQVKRIFAVIFPKLLIETRDSAMMGNLLPLIISGLTIPSLPAPPPDLIPHLLQLLVLRPVQQYPSPTASSQILELTLDLLISLSLNGHNARAILSQPNLSAHMKSLTLLLEYNAQPVIKPLDAPSHTLGRSVRNPASEGTRIGMATERRRKEREVNQRQMEAFGGPGVRVEVGDRSPVLSQAVKDRLYAMPEPARSISWMHETFVYSSTSQLLQVTFWHAYRDFFQNPATVEALLSASEVIKNVTIAFPGAMAKVWTDAAGGQKFVIAGIGFRKGSDDEERFLCQWKGCPHRSGSSNSTQLFNHVQLTHLSGPTPPIQCSWGNCTHMPFTLSHLLTHLPGSKPVPVPEVVSAHPSVPDWTLSRPIITHRPAPLLPAGYKLKITGQATSVDMRRNPAGASFLAALIIRNLARILRNEINLASVDLEQEKEDKKKHLLEERFGLPIPDNILKEEEEEERATGGAAHKEDDGGLGKEERERAIDAFRDNEIRLLEVIETNMSGLGQYLSEAVGWD